MSTGTVVEQLVVELDGRTQKLEAAMKAAELKLEASAKRMAQSTAGAGTAADASGAAAEGMTRKYARGAQVMASAAETAARAGKLTGESAKQMIAQGSMMASMFGPTGAIVGAVGIGTLAIVHMFSRAKEEAREAREKIQEEFAKITSLESLTAAERAATALNLGTVRRPLTEAGRAAYDAQRRALRGDADQFGAAFGLQGIREELELIEKERQAGTFTGLALVATREKLIAKQEQLNKLHAEAIAQITALGTADAGHAAAKARADAREKAAEDAKDAAKKAAKAVEDAEQAAGRARAEAAMRMASTLSQLIVRVEAEFNPLIIALRDAGDDAGAIRLEGLRDDAVESAIALEAVNKQLDEITRTSETAEEEYDRIGILIRETAEELANTTDNDTKRTQLNTKLADLYRQQDEALERIKASGKVVKATSDETLVAARETARAILDAANGALQLAAAFGLVSDESSQALRNVVQVAVGISTLITQIGANASKGDIVATVLSIAGGVASLVSMLSGSVDQTNAILQRLEEGLAGWQRVIDRYGDDVSGRTPLEQRLVDLDREKDELIRELQRELLPGGEQDSWAKMSVDELKAALPIVERNWPAGAAILRAYIEQLQAIEEIYGRKVQSVLTGGDAALGGATSYASSGFSAATATQFDRATDFMRQIALNTQPITSIDSMLRQAFAPGAPIGFSADVAGFGAPATSTAATAPISVTFQNTINIQLGSFADPLSAGRAAAVVLTEEFMRQIDIGLAQRARRNRQSVGDIRV